MSNAAETPFRYGLDALLRKLQWEIDLLIQDSARAARIVEERRGLLDDTRQRVQATMDSLRALYLAPEGISLQRRALLQTYLDDQRAIAERQEQDVVHAEMVHAQIQLRMRDQRTRQRVIEKHRERRLRRHRHTQEVRAYAQADEAWLLKRQGGNG